MKFSSFRDDIHNIWNNPPAIAKKPVDIIYMVMLGAFIGLLTSIVISIFRITTSMAFNAAQHLANGYHHNFCSIVIWIVLALLAGLLVGRLAQNPAVPFGGHNWIAKAFREGQPGAWRKVLLPKFIGSWLVMACCLSVGREGPCIQMGAAAALGLKPFDPKGIVERRYYIVAGCAAGLAAAFSAPFAGICYVYEVMREKLDYALFIFLLAGSFGVYVGCTQLFGLDIMLPLGYAPMPGLAMGLLMLPMAVIAGALGVFYNYLLRLAVTAYSKQRALPLRYRPLLAFAASALMVLVFPAVTGEGLTVFHGHGGFAFLLLFLVVKLVFTAFCYGSFIPAGLMVPVICIGGVAGKIYALAFLAAGLAVPETSFVIMGMAAAFAAAERAPITAIVLVAEMTGAYALAPGLLLCSAIGAFMDRLAHGRAV